MVIASGPIRSLAHQSMGWSRSLGAYAPVSAETAGGDHELGSIVETEEPRHQQQHRRSDFANHGSPLHCEGLMRAMYFGGAPSEGL